MKALSHEVCQPHPRDCWHLGPIAVVAQTATTPQPTISQRKAARQGCIAGGVKSGQLTAGETSHLEHQEAGINKEERGMRAQDNGHLTKQDRGTIKSRQNQESKRIYRDKQRGKSGKPRVTTKAAQPGGLFVS